MENILDLSLPEYIKKINTLDNDTIESLVLSDKFLNAKDFIIISTYNISNDVIKDIFINNNRLLNKLLLTITKQKSKFNTLNPDSQEKVIENIEVFINLNDKDYHDLLKTMSPRIYLKFIENLNNYIYNNNIQTNNKLFNEIKEIYRNKNIDKIKKYISKKFDIFNENEVLRITYNFINKKRNIFELHRITSNEQLYIYNKFGIVVSNEIFNEEKQQEYNISIELLKKLQAKHVIRLINELKAKEDYIESEVLFVTAIKLYCLFGLDNALKIIKDKFTYTTEASINAAAELEFTSVRRKYRMNHPDEFLNYELIEKLKKSLQNNELSVVKKITCDSDQVYIRKLFNDLKFNYTLYKNDDRLINYFNETIRQEIVERELNLKNIYISEYYLQNKKNRKPITCMELFKIFKEFDPFNTKFDDNGNVIMDNNLKNFLLDNEKSEQSNKALLRMVLNKQALDYNNELVYIINNFDKIQQLREKNNIKNKNSLLDTLDIYKTLQYKLDYSELDIPLSVISKIALSKKHLTIEPEEAITEFKRIYKENKKKYCSTIPKVKGETKDNYRYKILDKNDPEILTCGIDTGSCFKAGGVASEFFEYALTSPYSDVIAIWDPEGNFYSCPIIRNGNGIYGNGIDPDNISESKLPSVINALKKCYIEIIKKSNPNEKIDFCTMTTLHNYLKSDERKKLIEIDTPPMIGKPFYTDITKNDIDNYVLVGDATEIKRYIPTITYENIRTKKYVYSREQKENRLIIEQNINQIEYKSIEIKTNNKFEQEKFNEIKVDDYIYIVCNDDWYIAVKDNLEIKSAVLPYDPRAKFEYLKELQNVRSTYQTIEKLEKGKAR